MAEIAKPNPWFRKLKRVDNRHEYYAQGNSVWWNDMGDGVHVCDIEKYKESRHAEQYVALLNAVLSDDAIYELVARKLEK